MQSTDQAHKNENEYPVVIYDGVCHLCNSSVQFIIRHDIKKRFRFAFLDSVYAKALTGSDPSLRTTDSVWFVRKGKIHVRSTAVLMILRELGGIYLLTGIFFIIPAFIRDRTYDWIARHRYRWFGRYDRCMMPSPEIYERFIP
jgi:predicted DCC family thiol-disulfide oxidoreductase YuxK